MLFADGHVYFVADTINYEVENALGTRSNGEHEQQAMSLVTAGADY
jgi:hypothetical protein